MTKVLKVTISGSYRTSNKEIIDFENVQGEIPAIDEDVALMHIRGRYAPLWVTKAKDKDGNKLYPKRIEDMRQVFVDDIYTAESTKDFDYVGKDIKDMSYEDLQDLATAKDIRIIPLPKEVSGVSLREMRTLAYVGYSDRVLNKQINHMDNDFNYAKLPALIVDGEFTRDNSQKMTNDEIIEQEQKSTSTESQKSNLTLNDLKGIAKQKNIQFHNSIGFDALYNKVYGTTAA